jgi:hypothetical protein
MLLIIILLTGCGHCYDCKTIYRSCTAGVEIKTESHQQIKCSPSEAYKIERKNQGVITEYVDGIKITTTYTTNCTEL